MRTPLLKILEAAADRRLRPSDPPSPARIARLRGEVATGRYRVDPNRVAEAVIRSGVLARRGRSGPRG